MSYDKLPEISSETMLLFMAKAGFTNAEIAEAFGMKPSTFHDFIKRNPELRDKFEAAKDEPNQKVEGALFKRALGYQVKEIEKKNGVPIKVTIKELAPDPVSCIFWLKNRDPKKWRDVIEHKFSLRDRMDRAHDALSSKDDRPRLAAGPDKG